MNKRVLTSDLQTLWANLKRDDSHALKVLMEATYATMFGYGMKFSDRKEFVQDCIQDVFIAIWQHRHTLVVPDSPKGYLLTSLRRKMINNGVRGTWISLDALHEYDLEHDLPLEKIVFGHEELAYQMSLVQKLLASLPDRQREAVYLRYFQNLDRREIALIMNISEQSVSNVLQKALHSLRKSLPVGTALLLFLTAYPF
ncbi:sigma-70 family RNA polymerase sigma factor [Ravibacter arvi]|uniref:Sigma-70 family RNA polymerase sigma factor n=1 Tax=Ravibacter arvi TaxID=2051041 RepID=A0ABP8M0W9_9BACT